VEEIHRAVDGRTVLVDDIPGTYTSFLYFFADLRVGTSFTEPYLSLWVDQDMEELRAELSAHQGCVPTGVLGDHQIIPEGGERIVGAGDQMQVQAGDLVDSAGHGFDRWQWVARGAEAVKDTCALGARPDDEPAFVQFAQSDLATAGGPAAVGRAPVQLSAHLARQRVA
jgi:hypothetical protein